MEISLEILRRSIRMFRLPPKSTHYLSREVNGGHQFSTLSLGQPSLFPQGSAHRRMRFLLSRSKAGLREFPSDCLPRWQLSKANFHAHQDESPDVVETFENTFATVRFGVKPDRI
jgi:hypothetical protein